MSKKTKVSDLRQLHDRDLAQREKKLADLIAMNAFNPNSEALSNALLHGEVSEELLCFCCHAHEAPPQIQLTDPEFISAVRIEKWVSAAKLSQWPIIFLNTCRGGITHERYRTTFVSAFMRGGSVAVIGAEAEIDETYAAWFASEFMGAFVRR